MKVGSARRRSEIRVRESKKGITGITHKLKERLEGNVELLMSGRTKQKKRPALSFSLDGPRVADKF